MVTDKAVSPQLAMGECKIMILSVYRSSLLCEAGFLNLGQKKPQYMSDCGKW
jgi:hypothetical protein